MIASDEGFHRYSISFHDFEKALEFAEEAAQHQPNTITYEALMFAAIVSYYRRSRRTRGKE
jgi:hypothetical protein